MCIIVKGNALMSMMHGSRWRCWYIHSLLLFQTQFFPFAPVAGCCICQCVDESWHRKSKPHVDDTRSWNRRCCHGMTRFFFADFSHVCHWLYAQRRCYASDIHTIFFCIVAASCVERCASHERDVQVHVWPSVRPSHSGCIKTNKKVSKAEPDRPAQ